MTKILKVKNPSDYSSWIGVSDSHPLVSVFDYAEVSPVRHSLNDYNVYGLFLRDDDDMFGLSYGCGAYDYKKGTLICVAPGQIGGKEDNGELVNLKGWGLLFHPDLLHGTELEKGIRRYSFFDYRINEALHMTIEEHDIFVALLKRLRDELDNPHDAVQDSIITGIIGVLLNYCQRFYDRQFLTRRMPNNDILSRLETLLKNYFSDNESVEKELPTIQYCADKLCLSPNYLSDLVKKMTGDTLGNYIRRIVIQEAKNRLAAGCTVAETAYSLGFQYPQHLSRMFKKYSGVTPTEYFVNRKED
ncbi:MAG: helix-turn-helix domain-containing protein [Paramuribaculum sp.]|nr:helix-turn-helix domain-containing protein [Paramuribaculum sp.]